MWEALEASLEDRIWAAHAKSIWHGSWFAYCVGSYLVSAIIDLGCSHESFSSGALMPAD